jgi:hypothetical protein
MLMCEICGKESRIALRQDKKKAHYCVECYNELLAKLMGVTFPREIPKEISFYDNEMNLHSFALEFMLLPNCKLLKACETGESRYKCEVLGEVDDSFLQMWNQLMERLKKMMSVKYITPDGGWNGMKLLGYLDYNSDNGVCDIIIDGKAYTWEELGRIVATNEGFQIKIEIADPTDELE